MHISKDDAAAGLAAVQAANAAVRSAFRARRGHYYLWLWGVVWMAMALLAHFRGLAGIRLMPWLSGAGVLASIVIGCFQSSQVRTPIDPRFLGALASLVGFALLIPVVLEVRHISAESSFAYIALIVAQTYVVAGLWFDTYMVWFGVLLAALILLGLFVFTSVFWVWIAVVTGGAYLATGFYVRYFWR